MVVDDLNIDGSRVAPGEADPPLLVDPNAVLPDSVAAERLQRLIELVRNQTRRKNHGRLGATHEVLVERAHVQRGTFDDFIPVRGKLAPLSTVYLETIEGGRVDRRLVEDGAVVKAGQPLIELSNAAIQLDVISREAEIAE